MDFSGAPAVRLWSDLKMDSKKPAVSLSAAISVLLASPARQEGSVVLLWPILHVPTRLDRRHHQEGQPSPQPQSLPLRESKPSLAIIGTIANPATGSAHHQPKDAFSSKPPSRMAERYVQKSACLASALIAPLSIPAAT